MKLGYFKTAFGKLPLPIFFPDATRAVIKTLDSQDIKNTKTPGILVNTYHLYHLLGREIIQKHGGVRKFMSWEGGLITDSGGFQIMTLVKARGRQGKVTDQGVIFYPRNSQKIIFTPEKSISFQMILKPDMLVVLDDFGEANLSYRKAKEVVQRTLLWARRCKKEFLRICEEEKIPGEKRPYLLAVAQGSNFLDLRKECVEHLVEIGFDGIGWGGGNAGDKEFNLEIANWIARFTPKDYFLYGLGVGKPEEIIACFDLGYTIFDCVLPTRDARHKRLYIHNAPSIDKINIRQKNFYAYFYPCKSIYQRDEKPVSNACDCLLCRKYTRAYLHHLFRLNDATAMRLASIHNLRFYSIMMEKIREQKNIL